MDSISSIENRKQVKQVAQTEAGEGGARCVQVGSPYLAHVSVWLMTESRSHLYPFCLFALRPQSAPRGEVVPSLGSTTVATETPSLRDRKQ